MDSGSKNQYDLTEGDILNKMLLVALPIIGTQIVMMTYNLTDMYWLGRVGSYAVAASGTVGMYMWLSNAFMIFGRMGVEIGVSQNLGRGDLKAARDYGQTGVAINFILGLIYGLVLLVFREPLVGFFNIQEQEVIEASISYLSIIATALPVWSMGSAIAGVFNGAGNSRVTFVIQAIGLVINMVLDPLLILTFDMGVAGAAIATIIAQIASVAMGVWAVKCYKERPFTEFKLFKIAGKAIVAQIAVWAMPISIESFLFTFLSMFISRFVAEYGAGAMATQRIGSQIESLSWLIAGGYASALTAYIGQNYGAKKWTRIHKGFSISASVMSLWGIVVTAVLFFGGAFIFAVFLPNEPAVISMGEGYLKILAVCQVVGCLEGISAGAFRGLGRTIPPSVVSITCNFLRVIGAYLLSRTSMGLDGIWWAITIGAGARGLWILVWYKFYQTKLPVEDILESA